MIGYDYCSLDFERTMFVIIPRISAVAIAVSVNLPNVRVRPPIPAIRIIQPRKDSCSG